VREHLRLTFLISVRVHSCAVAHDLKNVLHCNHVAVISKEMTPTFAKLSIVQYAGLQDSEP
jgi:hypothetical protein